MHCPAHSSSARFAHGHSFPFIRALVCIAFRLIPLSKKENARSLGVWHLLELLSEASL